jgi:hypothetical protein
MAKKSAAGIETAVGYLLAGGIVYLLYRAFAPKTAAALPAPSSTSPGTGGLEEPKKDLWEAPPAPEQPQMPDDEPKEMIEKETKEAEVVNPFPPPKKHRRHPEMDGSFPAGSEDDDLLNDDNPDIL